MSDSDTSKKPIGKADARYWQQKGRFVVDRRSRFLCCKIQVRGRRESFPLRTANKTTAAAKAALIYGDVIALGWDAAMLKHKPDETPVTSGKVGALIIAVTELADVRPVTLAANVAAFRRIVGDIARVEATESRYAPSGAKRTARLAAIDAVPLEKITPAAIEAWKLAFVTARAAGGEDKARAARNSANTFLRSARSLFSKSLLRFLGERVVLPSPLPFEGVQFFPRQSMRYAGGFDVAKLIEKAHSELGQESEHAEEWKALLLTLFAGLRRNEADKLRWQSIDLAAGVIRIEAHGDFSPKAETSLGEVPINSEVAALLRGLRAREPKAVYVLAGTTAKRGVNYRHYRAAATFERLVAWLRANGVESKTPIHTLRKEAGSLVCQSAGLFAASRFLRHADVAITAQHYASQKDRVTVGMGALLAPAPSANVIPFTEPQPASRDEKQKATRRA